MEHKESMIGLRFVAEPTEENIQRSAELSERLLRTLVKEHNLTYNQILYPYADALSLSGMKGTESTRIFGTHILLRNISAEQLHHVMSICFTDEAGQSIPIPHEIIEIPLTEGSAKTADVERFLKAGKPPQLRSVGEFSEMLGGYVRHWRIREAARIYASFSEMSYRRAKGEILGLCGGKLILTNACDCPEAVAAIYTQKTGCPNLV